MPYFIDATDKPGTKDLRDKTRPEHIAFLDTHTRS